MQLMSLLAILMVVTSIKRRWVYNVCDNTKSSSYIASHDLIINSSGKICYQSCVYAAAMHTELELSTLSAVRVVNRQL